jgi:hypothetical protein
MRKTERKNEEAEGEECPRGPMTFDWKRMGQRFGNLKDFDFSDEPKPR